MEHLSLEIFDIDGTGSKYAALQDDASITITDTSEVFASGDVWSHPFTLNIAANAHIFGSAGDMHGSRLHDQVNRRRARLWVEGLPLYLGYLVLGDEVEVDEDGNVDVSFESGQKTFDDMIEGAKANQVPMPEDVLIGMALWRKRWVRYWLKLTACAQFGEADWSDYGDIELPASLHVGRDKTSIKFEACGEDEEQSVQEYPKMVIPKGDFMDFAGGTAEHVNCLNTDTPYEEGDSGEPLHPYCNIALCYQKYGYERKNEQGDLVPDYSAEPEAQRGYEEMPADRVNSAPCFFVIYWLRALMKHLDIYVEENQMLDVEDLRRLFFVNTKCAYEDLPQGTKLITGAPIPQRYGKYTFRGDGRLVPEYIEHRWNTLVAGYVKHNDRYMPLVKTEDSKFSNDETKYQISSIEYNPEYISPSDIPEIQKIVVDINKVEPFYTVGGEGYSEESNDKRDYERANSYFHKAFATSECFPDVDISEVIKAMENGFGIRFLFSDGYQRVRIVLLRNLFRSREVQHIDCDIIEDTKTENAIRGFRLTYGDSDDTTFYYKGFADKLPHKKELWADDSDKHDYSHWKLDAKYQDLISKVSAFDKTCYVTPDTGNAYGIKIDKDAKRYEELHPSLFEFAGYMDAEDGDCTGEEETIETINMGFTPAIMNDISTQNQRDTFSGKQRFALFVDETMRPRRPDLNDGTDYNDADAVYDCEGKLYRYDLEENKYVFQDMMSGGFIKPGEFAITSDMYAKASGLSVKLEKKIKNQGQTGNKQGSWATWHITNLSIGGHINEGYRLYLQDNFEPNDDGVCPIENHDWGLTLGIMRGSGDDAGIAYTDDNRGDPEDHVTWDVEPGSSITAHPDTCDSYGNLWDYNGESEGIGNEDGRISLKLRAEKPNPKFDPTKPETQYDPENPEANTNPKYLHIDEEKLRRRGIADQFYTEYSYWVRNARIANRKAKMELAQLLAIDKTKKVEMDDITGFIRKMQYTVSKKTGLGLVDMEIMYI